MIDDYSQKLKKLSGARKLLNSSRRSETDEQKDVNKYVGAFREVREVAEALEDHRAELDAKKRNQRKHDRVAILKIALTLLAIMVTFLGIVLAFITDNSSAGPNGQRGGIWPHGHFRFHHVAAAFRAIDFGQVAGLPRGEPGEPSFTAKMPESFPGRQLRHPDQVARG